MKTIILVFSFLFITTLIMSQTVYVTNTGKKYHSSGCSYLSKSKIPISLSDAKDKGYTACSKCSPPTTVEKKKTSEKKADTIKKMPEKKSENIETKTKSTSKATQCTGTTKAGKQCSRMTTDPSGRCYQHK